MLRNLALHSVGLVLTFVARALLINNVERGNLVSGAQVIGSTFAGSIVTLFLYLNLRVVSDGPDLAAMFSDWAGKWWVKFIVLAWTIGVQPFLINWDRPATWLIFTVYWIGVAIQLGQPPVPKKHIPWWKWALVVVLLHSAIYDVSRRIALSVPDLEVALISLDWNALKIAARQSVLILPLIVPAYQIGTLMHSDATDIGILTMHRVFIAAFLLCASLVGTFVLDDGTADQAAGWCAIRCQISAAVTAFLCSPGQ
jgi:hypothetical protein